MDRGLREIPPLHGRACRMRRSTKKKRGHSGRNDIVKSKGTAPLPAERQSGVKPASGRQAAALQKSRGKAAPVRPSALLPSFFRASRTGRTPKKATSKATAKATGKAKPRLAGPRARVTKEEGPFVLSTGESSGQTCLRQVCGHGTASSGKAKRRQVPRLRSGQAALRHCSLPSSGQAGQAAVQKRQRRR
jgi:hypothetical protein